MEVKYLLLKLRVTNILILIYLDQFLISGALCDGDRALDSSGSRK